MLRLIVDMVQFREFLKREDGATAIEYGLIAAGVAVLLIGAVALFGGGLTTVFTNIGGALTDAGGEIAGGGTGD